MKAIITGMNGTVAPVVADVLAKHDIETVAWDRTKVRRLTNPRCARF